MFSLLVSCSLGFSLWFLRICFLVLFSFVLFFSPCIFTKRKVKFMFMNRVLETRTIYLRSPVRAPRGQVNIVLGVTLKGLLSWESE